MGKEKNDHKMHLLPKQDSFSSENSIRSAYLFRSKCLGKVVSYDLCNLKTAYRWVDVNSIQMSWQQLQARRGYTGNHIAHFFLRIIKKFQH